MVKQHRHNIAEWPVDECQSHRILSIRHDLFERLLDSFKDRNYRFHSFGEKQTVNVRLSKDY